MGEKKSININLGLILLIVVIVGCFIMVYYKSKDSNLPEESDLNNTQANIEKSNIVENIVTNTQTNKDDENYNKYIENYKTTFKKVIGNGEVFIDLLGHGYDLKDFPEATSIKLDSNFNAYFLFDSNSEMYSKYGEKYKIAKDIANIYVCEVGTEGAAEVILINLDGTASKVKLDANKNIVTKDIKDSKNIVNVVNFNDGNEAKYELIDIENYINNKNKVLVNGSISKSVDIGTYFLSNFSDEEYNEIKNVIVDINNDAYLEFPDRGELYSKYGDRYKISSGVANVYVCEVGTAGFADIVLVNLDGTVSKISKDSDGNLTTEKVNDYRNIINVINYDNGREAISAFIDVNGNIK